MPTTEKGTEQGTERPVTGRPAAAVVAALVVVVVYGGVCAALWFTSWVPVLVVTLGGFLVFAVIGIVLMALRDTFWMGLGMLMGAGAVAVVNLLAVLVLADAFR